MKWSDPDVESVVSDLGDESERPHEPAKGQGDDHAERPHPDDGDETNYAQQSPEPPLPEPLHFAEGNLA